MRTVDYITQAGPGMCCVPIAMCNALRWWGLPSPEPGDDEWNLMVDVARCRYGTAIEQERVADWLGLVRLPSSVDLLFEAGGLPVSLGVRSPDGGLHVALVIEAARGREELTLVNYRYESGPLVERVPLDELIIDHGNGPEGWWLVPRWRPHG